MSISMAMFCTVTVDRRRVTVCQCRSRNTKVSTDWSSTIGAMMMISARAYSPFGIWSPIAPVMRR